MCYLESRNDRFHKSTKGQQLQIYTELLHAAMAVLNGLVCRHGVNCGSRIGRIRRAAIMAEHRPMRTVQLPSSVAAGSAGSSASRESKAADRFGKGNAAAAYEFGDKALIVTTHYRRSVRAPWQ